MIRIEGMVRLQIAHLDKTPVLSSLDRLACSEDSRRKAGGVIG